jgi:class 3 adenylate cyclase
VQVPGVVLPAPAPPRNGEERPCLDTQDSFDAWIPAGRSGSLLAKEPSVMERRLSAILAADVVGYARLMEDDEVGTLERLKALREDLLGPLIAKHRGRIVKLMGDGLLLEFQSVVEAVECAVAWQRAVGEGEADQGPEKALRFRIGVNLGDVIVEGEDIYGDGVNVAARLEGLAEPGGICASRAVFEQIKNRLDLDHVDLGEVTVKNIAEPVHAYRIRSRKAPPGAPSAAQASARAAPPRLEEARGSIAVFPFDSLSPDADDTYLADGIAMEIISMLLSNRGLFRQAPSCRLRRYHGCLRGPVGPFTWARRMMASESLGVPMSLRRVRFPRRAQAY